MTQEKLIETTTNSIEEDVFFILGEKELPEAIAVAVRGRLHEFCREIKDLVHVQAGMELTSILERAFSGGKA